MVSIKISYLRVYLAIATLSMFSCGATKENAEETLVVNQLVDMVNYNNRLSYNLNGQKISSSIILTDSLHKTTKLSDILTRNMIVLRLSQQHCEDCTNMTLSNLSKFIARKPDIKDRVLMLVTAYDDLYLKHIVNEFALQGVKAYRIDQRSLEQDIEKEDKPYLFTLNTDGVIADVHIPIKGIPAFTANYFDLVQNSR